MILATHLLEPSMVSSEFTLTHTLLTLHLVTLIPTLVTSTTQLDTKVLAHMMQDYSTAHMYLSRWYVLWEKTPSSPRLASRPDMVWLLTHLQKEQQEYLADLPLTPTATTEELQLRTSCDIDGHIPFCSKDPPRVLFFI